MFRARPRAALAALALLATLSAAPAFADDAAPAASEKALADKIGVPVSAPIDEIAACSLFGGIATPYQKATPKPKTPPPPRCVSCGRKPG